MNIKKDKIIMVHVPKTGGTSLNSVIWPGTPIRHRAARGHKAETWKEAFTFGFVRNPYERLASSYAYHCGERYQGELVNQISGLKNFGFREYLEKVASVRKGSDTRFWSMRDLLWHPETESTVDFLGRFERFSEDASIVLAKIAIDAPVPKKNESGIKNYDDILDTRCKKIILGLYEEDFEYYNYDK